METDIFMLRMVCAGFFILGGGALIGSFWQMSRSNTRGIGIMNLRAVCLIIIGTFVAMLAVAVPNTANAGFGILGAIVGYLFGVSNESVSKKGIEKDTSKSDTKKNNNCNCDNANRNQG